jgi:hypothetical protein
VPVDKEQQAADAAARAAATRQRLAEAAAAQEAEAAAAAAAAAQRRQRSEYKPGKLTAEEKAARLAAMMGDAAEHDRQRQERLHQVRCCAASSTGITIGACIGSSALRWPWLCTLCTPGSLLEDPAGVSCCASTVDCAVVLPDLCTATAVLCLCEQLNKQTSLYAALLTFTCFVCRTAAACCCSGACC